MLITGLFYIGLGCIFTYIAIYYGGDTVWSFRTLLPALFATFDFGVGIRFIRAHFRLQEDK